MTRAVSNKKPAPRLVLVTPMLGAKDDLAGDLDAALAAADIASVVLRLADLDERTLISRIKALAPAVQKADVALLLCERADLVARVGADGVHVSGIDALDAAIASLKPDRIAGAGGLATRHDAMLAAEAGADYVMFGEPHHGRRPAFDAILDRVRWWAEIFEVPCVAYAAEMQEIGALVAAGADFIAVDFVFAAGAVKKAVAEAAAQLAPVPA